MTRIPRSQSWQHERSITRQVGTSRREVLLAVGASTAATLLAGCLDEDETEDDPDGEADDGATDDDQNGDENGNGEEENDDDPEVPETFDDPAALRGHSRQFFELIATDETDAAVEWFGSELVEQLELQGEEPETLVEQWQSTLELDREPDAYESVAHIGTEMGNHMFILWAVADDEIYEASITYAEDGVLGFAGGPIPEWSPPEYVDEAAISETEVTLETPIDCSLGGTITVPADTDRPVPGVVLVHGNGPQDRNQTNGPNRSFKELAWGLASEGIAVLRYDKRTFTCEQPLAEMTIDEIVTDDALTATERLREHEQVDPDQVFVAGHSFGGLLAPRIADRDGDLAGVTMLAPGPARSFAETIVDQMDHLLDLDGTILPQQREQIMDEVRAEAEQIETLDIDDDEVVRFGGREFHETLQAYDHEQVAADLDIPLLLLQGGQDWQVTPEEDLPVWEDAIGEKENTTITVYDELNHLFQLSEGERTQAEYVEPDSPVSERVVEDIAAFVSGGDETVGAVSHSAGRRSVRMGSD